MAIQASPFSAPLKSLGVDLTATDTGGAHVLGSIAHDQSGNRYIYAFADTEAITANALVQVDSAGVVTLSNGAGDRIDGFAPTAIALDSYGWIGVSGDFAAVPATTGLVADDVFQHFATSSRIVIVHATGAAAGDGAGRGIVLIDEATNAATVRFF